jgi:hypothetical protein
MQARLPASLVSAPSRGGARPGPSHRDSSATPLREPGLPSPDLARKASEAPRSRYSRTVTRSGPHPDSDNAAEPSWRHRRHATRNLPKPIVDCQSCTLWQVAVRRTRRDRPPSAAHSTLMAPAHVSCADPHHVCHPTVTGRARRRKFILTISNFAAGFFFSSPWIKLCAPSLQSTLTCRYGIPLMKRHLTRCWMLKWICKQCPHH